MSFLSIADVCARWSCSKSFVYQALAEMERCGYLRRIRLGRVQRVAVESVERWEAEHTVQAPVPRRAPPPGPKASATASSTGVAIRALKVA